MGGLPLTFTSVLLVALCLFHQGTYCTWTQTSDDGPETRAATRLSLPPTLSPLDVLAIVCNNLQAVVSGCRSVPTMLERFGGSGQRVGSLPAGSVPTARRKRSGAWNNFNSFPSFPSFPAFNSHFGPSSGTPNSYSSGFNNNNNNNAFLCPSQTNQSAIYNFSPDSSTYPVADIGTELGNNQVLLACLAREVVLDTDGPTLVVDPFLLTSNATCPFSQLRLWAYQSQVANSQCFVLQNFQENILYKQCASRFPTNCKQSSSQSSIFGGSYSSSSATKSINTCLVEYNRVSLWAYCPSLQPGQRVIRDRIIVPTSCSPFTVPCESITSQHNW